MKTSDAGVFALALHEGIVPAPYRDSVGVWTYGIGHTAAAGGPDPAKMARGMPANLDAALRDVFDLFRADLPKYEAAVARAVKVPVTQAQFDALVSFHYNTGAVGKASFVKKLNAGDVAGAAAGFMAWKKPPEIIDRRKAEQALFAKGIYPTGQATVWQVSAAGKVIWKPARRLNKAQVMDLLDGPVAAPHVRETPASVTRPAPRVNAEAPKRPAQGQKPAKPSAIKETGKAAGGGLLGGGLALGAVAFWDQIKAFLGKVAAFYDALTPGIERIIMKGINPVYARMAVYVFAPMLGTLPGVTVDMAQGLITIDIDAALAGIAAGIAASGWIFAKWGKK